MAARASTARSLSAVNVQRKFDVDRVSTNSQDVLEDESLDFLSDDLSLVTPEGNLLTYPKLASYDFDSNAILLLALEVLETTNPVAAPAF